MTQQGAGYDSHAVWLGDIDYRKDFGAESAKLDMAAELVNARELVHMTQSALAELAGTSQAYIARLERGDANPTIGNIGRLFACMWLKPRIEPTPMEPFTSIESVVIQNLSASEASFDYSELISHPIPYSLQVSG